MRNNRSIYKSFCRLLAVLQLLPHAALAQTATATNTMPIANVDVGSGMSERLMCQTITLFQSQVGLLLGLAMGIMGLWVMIRSGKMKAGMILILGGALLSALPTLATGFFTSTSSFLNQTNLSPNDNSDTIMEPMTYMGQCDNIVIDLSAYQPTASLASLAARLSNADPVNAQAVQSNSSSGGSPASSSGGSSGGASGSGSSGSGSSGSSSPGVSSGAGCPQVVAGRGITRGFNLAGEMNPFTHQFKPHTGVDLGCTAGTPIHAGAAGRAFILGSGCVGQGSCGGGYGNHISVALSEGGSFNTYNHMTSINVSQGQQVNAGDVVGTCGQTGHATGPHLHYELKTCQGKGCFQDPIAAGCK